MKKYFSKVFALLLGVVVTLISCNNAEEVINLEEQGRIETAPVHIQVANFSMSIDDMPEVPTRAEVTPANYNNVKELTLAFYSGSTEILKEIQVRSDNPTNYETFGEFTCNLPAGSYTMVVVGRGVFSGDAFSLTSPTLAAYTSDYVSETFCATQSVTVTTTQALDLSVTLNRIVTLLAILSTDTRPADAAKIRITSSAGNYSFNPTTGLGTGDPGFTADLTLKSDVGKTIGVGAYAFIASDELTTDITLDVLDTNNQVLFRKSIPNVPLKRNRQTTLSGALFSPSATTASFTLETDWIPAITVTY